MFPRRPIVAVALAEPVDLCAVPSGECRAGGCLAAGAAAGSRHPGVPVQHHLARATGPAAALPARGEPVGLPAGYGPGRLSLTGPRAAGRRGGVRARLKHASAGTQLLPQPRPGPQQRLPGCARAGPHVSGPQRDRTLGRDGTEVNSLGWIALSNYPCYGFVIMVDAKPAFYQGEGKLKPHVSLLFFLRMKISKNGEIQI